MVFETLVFSPLNHLTRLIARENFIIIIFNLTVTHLKTRVEPSPEMSCVSNIPQTMDNIRYNILTYFLHGARNYLKS
jgi:hypothetical protein